MSVKLWWSKKPEYPYEYRAMRELCESLEPSKDVYFVFANFRLPNAQIDLTVFTSTSIFLIELKSSAGKPVHGSSNGSWTREDGTNLRSGNPVGQILHYYHMLRNWLNNNKEQFLTKNKASALILGRQGNAFNDIKKLIVLCPIRHLDSRIDVDDYRLRPFRGNIIGLNDLVNLIIDPSWESRFGIEFSPEEIKQMAEKLGLEMVPLSAVIVDLPAAHSESPGEERGTHQAHEKPAAPKKTTKGTRKQLLLWPVIVAAIILGIVLFVFIPRSPKIIPVTHTEIIPVAHAKQYIGREVRVRVLIGNVDLFRDPFPKYIMLYSGDFSIQVGPLDNPADELGNYEKFTGHCIIVGPAKMTTSGSGNPQIELAPDIALSRIADQGPGRCR